MAPLPDALPFRDPQTGAPAAWLAPMAGFTNAATRRICHDFGAVLTFTEMTNAAGLVHASDKTWQLLEALPGEGRVVAHLYGWAPDVFAAAARRVAALGRFSALDINAGCPVRKITRSGSGAALMRDPARIGAIVAAVRAACDLPVTVKTRTGLRAGHVSVFAVRDAVEAAGGAALIVHARHAAQGHTGPVDLPLLAELKRRGALPIVGNGGITGGCEARQMVERTGVDAVMIGRGAIGHPWIFRAAAAALAGAGVPSTRPSLEEVRRVLFAHVETEVELRRHIERAYPPASARLSPEEAAVVSFRCHFFRYLTGLKGATCARGRLSQLHTLADVRRVVDTCLAREAAYRARRPTPRSA